MEAALNGLGTTINSITGKVNAIKQRSTAYKQQIRTKLLEVVQQLQNLQNNQAFRDILQTKNQLDAARAELARKTQELQGVNQQLATATQQARELQDNLQRVTNELQQKNQELANLQQQNQTLNNEKNQLTQQVQELTREKTVIENQLRELQAQQEGLAQRLGEINGLLAQQIENIDTLANELPDNDFNEEFSSISNNIQAIINLINNPDQNRPPGDAQTYADVARRVNQGEIGRNSFNRQPGQRYDRGYNGGKKTKRNKKYSRMTKRRRQNGGYTYSAESANLKKHSSVVSDTYSNSSSKSRSKSRNRNKSKYRHKTSQSQTL
jgi:uncharacterized coiled-coil DUF342 family protein